MQLELLYRKAKYIIPNCLYQRCRPLVFYLIRVCSRLVRFNYLDIIYDEHFYRKCIEIEDPTSGYIVDILVRYFEPHSVIDIGCGPGIYLKEFETKGIDVVGFEGSKKAITMSLLNKGLIKYHDLRRPLKLYKEYDLCICFEVAEHIEKKYSNILVRTLAQLSNIVIFTAAPPGQGGRDHINEQSEQFWAKLFRENGFVLDNRLREKIRSEMITKLISSSIAKNLSVYRKLQ